MPTISLKIPDALNTELEEEARRTGRSKSLVVRMAISEFLPRHPPRPGSLLTRVRGVAGSVRGPRDLSTNKRRLEGYGR
jgi:hypothetical protein